MGSEGFTPDDEEVSAEVMFHAAAGQATLTPCRSRI